MMPPGATHCVLVVYGLPFPGCLSSWKLQLGGVQVELEMAHWGIGLWLICFASCTVEARYNNKECSKELEVRWKLGLARYYVAQFRGRGGGGKVRIMLNFILHLSGWWLLSREQTALWDDLPKWKSLAHNQHQTLHYVVWRKDQENQCNSEVSIWAMQKPVVSGAYLAWQLCNWISEWTF